MNGAVWLTNNWATISKWAKRWHKDEWGELVSQLALYIDRHWLKFSQIPDGEQRIKFAQTWMKNNVKWTNSEFNQVIRVNNLPDDWEMTDVPEENYIELSAEEAPQVMKDWIIDLHRNYSEKDVAKILRVREVYLELPLHLRVLYDLYFTQLLSMREIGKRLDLPLSAVYSLVAELKRKIKKQI